MPAIAYLLSPESCRAARTLLRLSESELADLAEISVSTLRKLEAGKRKPSAYVAKQIEQALEREGVLFVGPGRAPRLK